MASTDGLNATFNERLQNLMAAAPGKVDVISGYRSPDQQQALWDASDKSGKMVAAPGHSNHERGTAADLSFADPSTKQWVHDNAAKYGLFFPMSYEDWHIEPVGLNSDLQAYSTPPANVDPLARANDFFNHILGHVGSSSVDSMAATMAGVGATPDATTPTPTPSADTTTGPPEADKVGYQQAYQWVLQAGGTPEEARMLAAFAGAESGFNPGAVSKPNTNGTIDRGLFQINSVHSQYDQASLLDPVYNAKAALDIYRTQGPRAWTTYNTGAYREYLPGAGGRAPTGKAS